MMQLFILIFQGLLTLAGFLAGFIIKDMRCRISDLEKEVRGLKGNYLDRFNGVLENQGEVKEALIKQQTEVKETLIDQQHVIKSELIKQQTIIKDELLKEISQIRIDIAGIK